MDTPELSPRKATVLGHVGTFKQLSASQIGALNFPTQTTHTPLARCLKWLTDHGHLVRLPRRPPGGAGGGGDQYVYRLGRKGWNYLVKHHHWKEPYHRYTQAHPHTLSIAEVFIELWRASEADRFKLLTFGTEPTCHREVDGVLVTPDAYLEAGNQSWVVPVFLEVDRGGEGRAKLEDKFRRYGHAYRRWGDERGSFPLVLFVVPDPERYTYIERLVSNLPEDEQRIYELCFFGSVAEAVERLLQ